MFPEVIVHSLIHGVMMRIYCLDVVVHRSIITDK